MCKARNTRTHTHTYPEVGDVCDTAVTPSHQETKNNQDRSTDHNHNPARSIDQNVIFAVEYRFRFRTGSVYAEENPPQIPSTQHTAHPSRIYTAIPTGDSKEPIPLRFRCTKLLRYSRDQYGEETDCCCCAFDNNRRKQKNTKTAERNPPISAVSCMEYDIIHIYHSPHDNVTLNIVGNRGGVILLLGAEENLQ